MTYGHFRSRLIARIFAEALTPLDVAAELTRARSEHPEIRNDEITRLNNLGRRWDGRDEPQGEAPEAPPAIEEDDLWGRRPEGTPF